MTAEPTAAELTRAAELAPRVAAIAGLDYGQGPDRRTFIAAADHSADWPTILCPAAFQAVLLALPRHIARDVENYLARWWAEASPRPDGYYIQWRLTPAGMLAFYEALVALEGGDA